MNVKWRPFVSFEFFDHDQQVILTDGETVTIYVFHQGAWVSAIDEMFDSVEYGKDMYYITNDQAVRGLNDNKN